MKRTFYDRSNREPKIIAMKNRSRNDPASSEEKSPAAEKKIAGGTRIVAEKEVHLTATYWG